MAVVETKSLHKSSAPSPRWMASTWRPARASTSSCSAHPAAARQRCCGSSRAWSTPATATSSSGAGGHPPAPRTRQIAMVFQSYALYPHKTVFANIAFPLAAAGVPRAMSGRRRCAGRPGGSASTSCSTAGRRQLSGGERQRRRAGPGAGPGAAGVPARRAAVQPGRQAPLGGPRRAQGVPAAGGDHHHLRHPRPGRGDGPRRPHRRAQRGEGPADRYPR